jgi:phosphoglycolate phosphatase-like HAD superfamily hydrolase
MSWRQMTATACPVTGSPWNLVIFDSDGVLVDSGLLSNELLAEMMSELGHPMTTICAIRTVAPVVEAE